MIFTFILIFLIGLLDVIHGVFALVTFLVPNQVVNAFATFFGYVNLGDGVFPFTQALIAIGTVLTVWLLLYVIKLVLFVFSLIPWIGKVIHLPNHHTDSLTETESYNARGGLIGRSKSRRSGDSY